MHIYVLQETNLIRQLDKAVVLRLVCRCQQISHGKKKEEEFDSRANRVILIA